MQLVCWRYLAQVLVFLVLSSSTPKMGNFFCFGRSAMIWDQSKPAFFLVSIKYHHYHIKWAISCCQGNFSAEFSSCKHNFPKIIFWLIRSMQTALSLPVYTDFFNFSQWEMIWNKPFKKCSWSPSVKHNCWSWWTQYPWGSLNGEFEVSKGGDRTSSWSFYRNPHFQWVLLCWFDAVAKPSDLPWALGSDFHCRALGYKFLLTENT